MSQMPVSEIPRQIAGGLGIAGASRLDHIFVSDLDCSIATMGAGLKFDLKPLKLEVGRALSFQWHRTHDQDIPDPSGPDFQAFLDEHFDYGEKLAASMEWVIFIGLICSSPPDHH